MPRFLGPSGVLDNGNRAYSDTNAPDSLDITLRGTAPAAPAAGKAVLYSADGKALMIEAPDGTITNVADDPIPNPADQGLKAWSFDPTFATGTATPAAGVLQLVRISVRQPTVISGIAMNLNTIGATLTNVGFALYTNAALGTLITSSVNANGATAANFSTSGGTGMRTVTFTSPPTLSTPFYVAFWFTGTTMPTFQRCPSGGVASFGQAAAPFRYATANTGLTTTAPSALTAQTTSSNPWLVGII